MNQTGLAKYDAARYALSVAVEVDEVKDIRDKAAAMAAYARQAQDKELLQWATEIKVRAERRAGEMMRDTEKNKGLKGSIVSGTSVVPVRDNTPTLADMGISKNESSRWQKLAAVSNEKFEEAVAAAKEVAGEVTTAYLLKVEKMGVAAALGDEEAVRAHVANNSGNNEWYTPAKYIDLAREVMGGIDCDPATSEIANQTVKAKTIFTVEDDGLAQTWRGRVWMNPPYAQPLMSAFAEAVSAKFESGEIEQACILVNNATETQWFQRMVSVANAVCFPKSRIKFLDSQGKPGAPLQGQAIIYMGDNIELFVAAFKLEGAVLFV